MLYIFINRGNSPGKVSPFLGNENLPILINHHPYQVASEPMRLPLKVHHRQRMVSYKWPKSGSKTHCQFPRLKSSDFEDGSQLVCMFSEWEFSLTIVMQDSWRLKKKKATFEIRLGMGWNTPNNTFLLVRTLVCKRFFCPSSARPIHKVQPTHYEKKLWIWGFMFWLKSKRKKKVRHTMWTKPNKIYVWAVGLCLFHG